MSIDSLSFLFLAKENINYPSFKSDSDTDRIKSCQCKEKTIKKNYYIPHRLPLQCQTMGMFDQTVILVIKSIC